MFVAYVAVAAFVVGVGAQRAPGVGETLAGLGELFVGLAAALAALAAWRTNRQLTAAAPNVERAAEASSDAAAALGTPTEGATVVDLLQEIREFEEYQHRRNHDILGAIQRIGLAAPLLIDVCERLLSRLQEDRP